MRNRVVITGLGVVSAIGTGKTLFWQNLLSGKSGVSPITSFDTAGYEIKIGAEIKDFAPEAFLSQPDQYARPTQLAIAATRLAISDSGIPLPVLQKSRSLSMLLGTSIGGAESNRNIVRAAAGLGIETVAPRDYLQMFDSLLPLNISQELELQAGCLLFHNACSAGNTAIGYGFDLLQRGQTELVFAGGVDAFSQVAFAGFQRLFLLAPEKCQPFDKNRQGAVIGEGAGILIMETLPHALKRGARIYAELLGYGQSCEAHHMLSPLAEGAERMMQNALAESGVLSAQVDLICAHGTGTLINDQTECDAIASVFASSPPPVISLKSMLGHAMGAASALEAIASVLAIYDSKIPPTINYETPDQACPVDCVPNRMRNAEVNLVLNNAIAFGNSNVANVFARYQESGLSLYPAM